MEEISLFVSICWPSLRTRILYFGKQGVTYTLMATRADPRPIPWRWLFRESPERWRLAHVDLSKLAYNEIYPDGRLSKFTAYTGLHPDGDSSWRLAHVDPSELVCNGIYPDGHPSRSTTYKYLHPNDDSS